MSQDTLNNLFQQLKRFLNSGKEFVAYREPNSNQIYLLTIERDSVALNKQDCFVVQPFDPNQPIETYRITHEQISLTQAINKVSKAFSKWSFDPTTLSQFENLVSDAVNRIKYQELKKVVLHSQLSVKLNCSVIEAAKRLLLDPVNAYRYVLYTERFGLWMGATPELLIKTSKNHYETMALAGTRVFKELPQNPFNQKEVEEQQWVSTEIRERLEPYASTIYVSETEIIKAGKLAHLKNDFSGEFLEGYTTIDLAKALHPTAAVCGYPKDKALAYISTFESYDRSIYAGYLGRITNEISSVYVNIRSGRFKNDRFTAFVGAGITKDSSPANEAVEIQSKTSTLATIFS